MRIFISALQLVVVTTLVVGCSANNQATHSLSLPGWLALDAQKSTSGPLLYVSLEDANEVLIFPESPYNQSPIGMITSGVTQPWGLYVDKNGNLYVANLNDEVTVYPAGSVYPSVTYIHGLCHPLFTIVDHQGDVFVANGRLCNRSHATVIEYLLGSKNVYHVLETPGTEVNGMDFDQQGNLYVAYRINAKNQAPGSVERFAPGSRKGHVLGMTVHQPQGLVVDNNGNILVVETAQRTHYVAVFAPGAHHPKVRVKLPEGSIPNQIAITEDETKLFVSSYDNGYVYVANYPLSKGSPWTEVEEAGGIIQGVALTNGQVF
jgi:DNA-binding beta-propeller fold protein YncE